jgi:arginine decarboxylase
LDISETEEAADVLHECFSLLTTTSPNVVLLASLDATRAQMAGEGVEMIQRAAAAADEIRYELRQQNLYKLDKPDECRGLGVNLLNDSPFVTDFKDANLGIRLE